MTYAPDITPPFGYVYQWKRYSLLGEIDHKSIAEAEKKGWVSVPSKRHPEFASEDGRIIVGGLMLMELREDVYLALLMAQQKTADNQYNAYAAKLEDALGGDIPIHRMDRVHLVKLNKGELQ